MRNDAYTGRMKLRAKLGEALNAHGMVLESLPASGWSVRRAAGDSVSCIRLKTLDELKLLLRWFEPRAAPTWGDGE